VFTGTRVGLASRAGMITIGSPIVARRAEALQHRGQAGGAVSICHESKQLPSAPPHDVLLPLLLSFGIEANRLQAFRSVPKDTTQAYLFQQITRDVAPPVDMPQHYLPTLVQLDIARDQREAARAQEAEQRRRANNAIAAYKAQAQALRDASAAATDAVQSREEAVRREQKALAAAAEETKAAARRVKDVEAAALEADKRQRAAETRLQHMAYGLCVIGNQQLQYRCNYTD
jgi:flagellar biosynthesis GTPase FlhF